MSAVLPAGALLRPELLAALGTLDLVARAAVDGLLIGLHRTPEFGFSQEFAEYRAYREGDDVRFVDWNVYARTGRAYMKQYRGETSSHLTLLIDASASMGFGSGKVSKLDCARMLAAALAYLARRQHDAVGLLVFDDAIREYRPPRSGTAALASILHGLERATPRARTDFAPAVAHYCAHRKGAGMLAVMSDFLADPEQLLQALKPLRALRTDVMLFQLLDQEELEPRLDQPVRYEDVETGAQVSVLPGFMHEGYRERIQAHIDRVRDACLDSGVDHVLVNTHGALDQALRSYLLRRQVRR